MNRLVSLLIVCFCMVLSASCCANVSDEKSRESSSRNGDDGELVTELEVYNEYAIGLTFDGTKDDNGDYCGKFFIASSTLSGDEICRYSLNQFFQSSLLYVPKGATLHPRDYNNDGELDFLIGFPANDSAEEYMYLMFSINKKGVLYILPIEGYKEYGYIYSVNSGNFPELVSLYGVGEGNLPSIAVGVNQDNIFVPATYVWTDGRFQFVKENEYIISSEPVPDASGLTVTIVQTEFMQPKRSYDEQFTIYKSYILGCFDAVAYNKNGKETDRISLNKLFSNQEIGWAGRFNICFKDYNSDGYYEFSIAQPLENGSEFQCVLVSIDSSGQFYALPTTGYKEDGYIYNSSDECHFKQLESPDIGISVTLNTDGWYKGQYVWNGETFVFGLDSCNE